MWRRATFPFNKLGQEPKSLGFNHHTLNALVAQSCSTLCDPVDCSLPCYSVHGTMPLTK